MSSGFLRNLGSALGIGGGGGKLPPGNSQWAQLANFFPKDDKSVNGLDLATFYGGEDKGYTDYPAYDELTPA